MEKGGNLRRGGSSRLSTPMRSTGGDNDGGVLDKSSKKEKVRRLSEMDQLSHSITTNSTSKRIELPKKFSDHCCTINHVSVPRKLRSAMKKREHESLKASPSLPKKPKAVVEEHEDSKTAPSESVVEEITKDEEEVVKALFALAQTVPIVACSSRNETSEAEPVLLVLQETKTPNEPENTNDFKDETKSRKRCSVHVYICHFIKASQTNKHKDKRANVISDPNPQKITNKCDDQMLNEAKNTHERLFEDQWQPKNVADIPETTALTQLQDHACTHLTNTQSHHLLSFDGHLSVATSEQVPPYIHTMHYDRSQWSTQIPSKQQYWENQLQTGCYRQNWLNGSYDTTPLSGSSVQTFGSKHALGSKHILNTQQQQQGIPVSFLSTDKGKMQFCYNEKGGLGLFLVDSAPTLKLTL